MLWLIQRRLKSKNATSRRKAAEQLCGMANPHALAALRDALGDEDAEVRTLALRLLDETTDARMIPNLVKMIQTDPEPESRARAATVLGQFVRMGEMEEIPASKRKIKPTIQL